MTDADHTPDEEDPLLVRPYISTGPAPTGTMGTTWPAAGDETQVIPVTAAAEPPPGAEPPAPRAHRSRLLLAIAALVVLVVGTAFALTWHPAEDAATVATGARPSASATTATAAATKTAASPAGDVEVTTGARATTTNTSTTPAAPQASATTVSKPPTSTAPTSTTPTTPAATLSAAPATALIGTITGAGGLCLDLNSALAIDGNRIQVFFCNNTGAQRWTLAPDGTLQVLGKCAQSASDGTVQITTCGSKSGTQWRRGRSRSLVNVGSGRCLTDPRSGALAGTWVQLATCTGAAGQQWSLP